MATRTVSHRPAKTTPARKYEPIPCEPGVMIIGEPGSTPPPGYVSVPRLTGAAEALTPPVCRNALAGAKAVHLLDCWVSKRGPGVYVLFGDGEPCSMYLLDLEHISDPLFDALTAQERDRIADHFMNTPPAELQARFLPQEKPSFTLLRRCADVRLWGSQTVACEVHGQPCGARTHYHVTVNSEAHAVLMRDYDTALANFHIETGELA